MTFRVYTPQHDSSCPFIVTPIPNPAPWQPLINFLSLYICLFRTFHINGISWSVVFCVGLLSLSVFLRFFHDAAQVRSPFLFCCWVVVHCSVRGCSSPFMSSCVPGEGHLGCFQFCLWWCHLIFTGQNVLTIRCSVGSFLLSSDNTAGSHRQWLPRHLSPSPPLFNSA